MSESEKPITAKTQLSKITERVSNTEKGIEEIKKSIDTLIEAAKNAKPEDPKNDKEPLERLELIEKSIAIIREGINKPPLLPPNVRQMFAQQKNEQAELTRKLLTSDEDNYTKSRIPSVFAMTNLDTIGPYASGKYKSVDQMLSPDPMHPEKLSQSNLYRVNSISYKGQSRDEYKEVMQPIGLNSEMMQWKMNEKTKLKEGSRK